jgi:hypothetical protein
MTISAVAGTRTLARQALHHRQRLTVQGARDFEFVVVDRRDRLGGEQRQRIDADHHRHVERLVRSPRPPCRTASRWRGSIRIAMRSGPWTWMRLIDTFCTPVFGIAGDDQAGGDVGAAVMFAVGRDGQHRAHVAVAVHHLPHGASTWRLARLLRPRARARVVGRIGEMLPAVPPSTPIASAIQARRATKPETTAMAWPPGRGK